MLSVLIVNWNAGSVLKQCLDSLQKWPLTIGPSEIIVIDNDSQDSSAQIVRENFPKVTLIEPGVNTGYAGGNNIAYAKSQYEYVLTLNPDTEITPGALDRAVSILMARQAYGCLAAKLVGMDGEVQSSIREFPTLRNILGDVLGAGKRSPHSQWGNYRQTDLDYDTEAPVPQPMGTFLLFRRTALQSIGAHTALFDETFPIFFNEVDLQYRLKKAGWPCLYSPEVVIRHHGGFSTKQIRKEMIWESHRSLGRYLQKHQLVRFPAAMNTFLALSAFIRAKGYSEGFRP